MDKYINKFNGPLFIIGVPRSGTKLLRDLLNRYPQIGIPDVETIFIPYMIERFGTQPDFEKYGFNIFYKEFKKTSFFKYHGKKGRVLTKKYLECEADLKSWHSIFEVILRYYAPDGKDKGFIWGDKTPGYNNHMVLLKNIFPRAKFLHIIRDPRDNCLSIKRVWGKSLFRAAERWREIVTVSQVNGRRMGECYKELLYEKLLDNPEQTLREVCDFLDCSFLPEMTSLERPSENYGDAKGQIFIVSDNKKKYLNHLTSSEIMRIEEIVCPIMRYYQYNFENEVSFKPLNSILSGLLRLYDAWAMIRFRIRDKGIFEGLRSLYNFARVHR